jgi:hypothetical protein
VSPPGEVRDGRPVIILFSDEEPLAYPNTRYDH